MGQRVLVVAAHPDDEVLGCGGTIARHRAEGDDVSVLFLADGVGARGGSIGFESELAARRAAGDAAATVLGISRPVYLDFPDNRLDTVAFLDLVQAVERMAEKLRPNRVYTHHSHDLNIDHRLCHRAVLTAFRPTSGQTVRAIYGFEIPSSTDWAFGSYSKGFQPNHFVDISNHIETKLTAMNCYETEMKPPPHPRSTDAIKALACWRGASVGCFAAEAFAVIYQIA